MSRELGAKKKMNEIEIVHEIVSWEVKYGYMNTWSGDYKRMKAELPLRFKVVCGKEVLQDRHFDGEHRIYVGRSFMKRFVPGQKLKLTVAESQLYVKET